MPEATSQHAKGGRAESHHQSASEGTLEALPQPWADCLQTSAYVGLSDMTVLRHYLSGALSQRKKHLRLTTQSSRNGVPEGVLSQGLLGPVLKIKLSISSYKGSL